MIGPGEQDTVCIYLEILNVATDEVTESSWRTIAEITSYTNEDDETKTTDADSTPDDDLTNDPGGNPFDDTDDEVDGDGSGDPMDPAEDTDPELDEDDNDPADIYICDIATIIYTETESPADYYDTIKFNIEIHNQGNGSITNVELSDRLPSGWNYIATTSNEETGWIEDADGDLTLIYDEVIPVGQIDTLCLEL
jgi:uncharacterized repeat protein (TIGR01451 family)